MIIYLHEQDNRISQEKTEEKKDKYFFVKKKNKKLTFDVIVNFSDKIID